MTGVSKSSVRAVGPLLDALSAAGHPRPALAARLGLPAGALDEDGPGLDVDAMRALWTSGAVTLADARVGLHLGARVSRGSFDLVSYLAASSACLEEALVRIQRYLRLLTRAVDYELVHEGAVASFRMVARGAGVAPIRHADEFSIAARCTYVRQWLGRPFRPHEVWFRHALEPGETSAEYEAFFGCPVRFESRACGFAFDARELAAPLVGADPSLGRLLGRYADDALASLPADASVASRVREALVAGMEAGDVSVAHVAKKLATSERSLQRRLREENASFAELLEGVRRELAIRYLGQATLSVAEVAYMLGYSEKATFFRAFRKWTGETPGAFRDKRAGERLP